MVNLSWSLVANQFEAQYDDVYMHKDAKVKEAWNSKLGFNLFI